MISLPPDLPTDDYSCQYSSSKAPSQPLTPGQQSILDEIPVVSQGALGRLLFGPVVRPAGACATRLDDARVSAQKALETLREQIPVGQREAVETAASHLLSQVLPLGSSSAADALELAQARLRLYVAMTAETEARMLCAP